RSHSDVVDLRRLPDCALVRVSTVPIVPPAGRATHIEAYSNDPGRIAFSSYVRIGSPCEQERCNVGVTAPGSRNKCWSFPMPQRMKVIATELQVWIQASIQECLDGG